MGARQHSLGAVTADRKLLPVRSPRGQVNGAFEAPSDLRVMTFNIWFGPMARADRARAVVRLMQKNAAHVICLQEVTAPAWNVISNEPWVAENCYLVDPSLSSFTSPYGVVILSTLPVEEAAYWNFSNSRMGRGLMEASIRVAENKVVRVGTVHLESLDSVRVRREQLLFSASVMATYALESAFLVLCGDFNFDCTRNYRKDGAPLENDTLRELAAWCDAWPAVHARLPGHTFDTVRNKMLSGRRPERMRFDRVLTYGRKPRHIQIVGNEPMVLPKKKASEKFPSHVIYDQDLAQAAQRAASGGAVAKIDDTRLPIYPSDHFGLVTSFVL
eukprot:gene16122-24697_t